MHEKIIKHVGDFYGINILHKNNVNCRKKDLVNARFLAMYFLINHTNLTYTDIGWIFEKDHALVSHANKKIKGYLQVDAVFRKEFKELEEYVLLNIKEKDKKEELIFEITKKLKKMNIEELKQIQI